MAEAILTVSGLVKAFGAMRAADGISLNLLPGEIHALIGPNGAGKSTLMALMSGMLAPDHGKVWFRGRDVTVEPPATRAAMGLARTFQVSSLLPEFTARQHVRLAEQARGRLGMWHRTLGGGGDALARVGLGGREDVVVADMSHGERRRLEIALALAARPTAFLMDEPMAGMGAEGARDLTALLDGLRAEAPILLVEHDMDAVFALADRISVLVYGRVIASGTPAEIRANRDVQEAYLGA